MTKDDEFTSRVMAQRAREDLYLSSGKCAPPPEDSFPIHSIEINFADPCFLTFKDQERLNDVVERIVRAPHNQPAEGVHWVAGSGSKPHFSVADAAFLGKEAEAGAPDVGEPTFEDEVFFMESSARSFGSDDERAKVLKRRVNAVSELERVKKVLNSIKPHAEAIGVFLGQIPIVAEELRKLHPEISESEARYTALENMLFFIS